MKYYINIEKNILLVDENDFTSYLEEKGYVEITKQEYDEKSKELEEQSEDNDEELKEEKVDE